MAGFFGRSRMRVKRLALAPASAAQSLFCFIQE
jgi:hypothetical protein